MKKPLLLLLMTLLAPLAINAQALIYSEGFEGGSMPTGWTQDGDWNWLIANNVNTSHPGSAGNGNYCAQITHKTTGNATKLITPVINLSSVHSAELSFMHVQQAWDVDVDGLKVYYRTSTSGTWTQLAEYTNAYASWTTESGIALPNLSSTYQIAFEHIDNWGYGLGVDDVKIVEGAFCHNPTDLTCTLTPGNGTVANLSWTAGDSETVWTVEYATNSAFTNPQTKSVNNTPSTQLTGLTPNTRYYARVFAVCGVGDESEPSNVVTFTTEGLFTKDIVGYGDSTNRGNYYLIASPIGTVNPECVDNMTTNSFDLYRFNQAADLEWEAYNAHGFDLEPGKGYLYANIQDVTLTFHGHPIETVGPIALSVINGKDFTGWNLVGNPFAVPAYIEGIGGEDVSFYTLNEDGSKIVPVTSFAGIAPMEGIFVYAQTDGEQLTFTTTAPSFKGSLMALNLSNDNGLVDRAMVRFDQSRQLPKFQLWKNSSELYIPMDGKDYAVVRGEEIGEMPVSFKAERNGSYTLGFNTENVEFGYLHLIDNMTGTDIDLLETPSYRFEAKTTDDANRFKLVFATGNTPDDHFAFFSNGSLVISNEGKALMNVYDVTGRLINSQSINGNCQVGFNAAPGVYMVHLVNGDNTRSQKIVVK